MPTPAPRGGVEKVMTTVDEIPPALAKKMEEKKDEKKDEKKEEKSDKLAPNKGNGSQTDGYYWT